METYNGFQKINKNTTRSTFYYIHYGSEWGCWIPSHIIQ